MESIAELRGEGVVDLERGAILGTVCGVTVDPNTGRIAALVYKARKGARQKFFVPTESIEKIGRDLVLLKSDAGRAIDEVEDAPGISLKELQGCWVTTLQGKHLGTLVDIDFASTDWRISDLELAHGKRMAVEAEEVKIGDEILVPAEYAARLTEIQREKYGVMGRLLGAERIDDLRRTMRRTLERPRKKHESDEGDAPS